MCQAIVLSRKRRYYYQPVHGVQNTEYLAAQPAAQFTPGQFKLFKDFTSGMDIEESLFPFLDGEEPLLLPCTPDSCHSLFTRSAKIAHRRDKK